MTLHELSTSARTYAALVLLSADTYHDKSLNQVVHYMRCTDGEKCTCRGGNMEKWVV